MNKLNRNKSANFILHLLLLKEAFIYDHRLTPWHVSLYYALFFEWNKNGFNNPFAIFRSSMMSQSKIGSANTYSKCIKELQEFGYIEYFPSHNPYKGSLVNMYTFDTTTGATINTSKYIKNDTTSNTSIDTSLIPPLRPFNKENKTKEILKLNKTIVGGKSELKFAQAKTGNKNNLFSQDDFQSAEILQTKTPKPRKVAKPPVKDHITSPPPIDEIKSYFLEKESTSLEAEKFFNHFESNGWLVGGKTKMKNWQAAARNWILNGLKFKQETQQARFRNSNDHLHVNQDKDYSIPL